MNSADVRKFASVLGGDGTGKSTVIEQLMANYPITGLHNTNPAVYRQLHINGISGLPHEFNGTPLEVERRRRCFLGMNVGDMALTRAITMDPLVGVPIIRARGWPDTVITHDSLGGLTAARSLTELLPEEHRPDLLVILTADPKDIVARVTKRGEPMTGANSLDHILRCQREYLRLGEMAQKAGVMTLVYDTSRLDHNPGDITAEIAEFMLQAA